MSLKHLPAFIVGAFAIRFAIYLAAPTIFDKDWHQRFRHWTSTASMASTLPFDPLVASASDLQELLDAGKVTSEDLVNVYLDQIKRHNRFGMRLNAIIATADRDSALQAARALDQERRSSGKRGPLHGIPVVIKA
ncbi:hypothetical protein F5Y01DRAFT_300881 [Xylaria sp. FL0043]|nr:hypothetical protein F5Y01DRAFT_300881 [Xylaria sp. FL0043]